MAHPARAKAATRLAQTLTATIVWDRGRGEWDTGRRAWNRLAGLQPDWGVVIQDDAQPVDNLPHHLDQALAYTPSRAGVSLYTGTGNPLHLDAAARHATQLADHYDAAWLVHSTLGWGVAVALPGEHIQPMLDHAEHVRRPYDERITAYLQRRRLPCYYTNPSLIDHADGPTLIHARADGLPRDRARKAVAVGTRADWNRDTVPIR